MKQVQLELVMASPADSAHYTPNAHGAGHRNSDHSISSPHKMNSKYDWLHFKTIIAALLLPIAVVMGVANTTQAGIDASLGNQLGNGSFAVVWDFLIASVLLLFGLIGWGRRQQPSEPILRLHRDVSWWEPLGGLFGAFYVLSATFISPKIGFSLFFVLAVLGQITAASFIDQTGFLGQPRYPASKLKAVALLLTITGAVLSSVETFGEADATTLSIVLQAILAFLAGVALPLQATVGFHLSSATSTPMHSVFILFVVGLFGVFAVAMFIFALEDTTVSSIIDGFGSSEVWMFAGGLLGLTYVASSIYTPPVIGVSVFFVSVITGQLLSALIYDQFGIITPVQRDATALRIAGTLIICVSAAFLQVDKKRTEKKQAQNLVLPNSSSEKVIHTQVDKSILTRAKTLPEGMNRRKSAVRTMTAETV